MFQSTRPRGARLLPIWIIRILRSFNPRAREGRDGRSAFLWKQPHSVSIHAPARGATLLNLRLGAKRQFQSTRPRGARLW